MADEICGCSGVRHCLICEEKYAPNRKINEIDDNQIQKLDSEDLGIGHYCLMRGRIVGGKWKVCLCSSNSFFAKEKEFKEDIGKEKSKSKESNDIEGQTITPINKKIGSLQPHDLGLEIPLKKSSLGIGVNDIIVIENFVTEEEEELLKFEIYQLPWKLSQSGRRKQDFGPQANFKRKKVKVGNFTGLPFFLKDLVSKMSLVDFLVDFVPVEVCHLEYCSTRGSSIDPHVDDAWLWGERLVTLSLLSSSILTLTSDSVSEMVVEIPMPQRSLLILQGKARNLWKHSIQRKDIENTRLALTFRELSQEFVSGSQTLVGSEILKIAKSFDGKPLFSKQI